MKIPELRNIIQKYNSNDKDKIIVELYKRIPKRVKEDYDIDDFITNITLPKEQIKKEEVIDIDYLEAEVDYFIECANEGLYVSPNRIISKSERGKWRFKAKKYYKELNSFKPDTEDGMRATDLLIKLYKLLSYGTHYLRFSSWNTFGALGVNQSTYYNNIVKRLFANGVNEKNLTICISLLDIEYDSDEYYESINYVFESNLIEKEDKYKSIEIIKTILIKLKDELKELEKKKKETYYKRESINAYVSCVTNLYLSINEPENAINFFENNYIEYSKEVLEYILLEKLEDFDYYKEWIDEYERHMFSIDYRHSLKDKYKEFKKMKKE